MAERRAFLSGTAIISANAAVNYLFPYFRSIHITGKTTNPHTYVVGCFSTMSGIFSGTKSSLALKSSGVTLVVERVEPEDVPEIYLIELRHETVPPVEFRHEPGDRQSQSWTIGASGGPGCLPPLAS